jgi:hypothetical protein
MIDYILIYLVIGICFGLFMEYILNNNVREDLKIKTNQERISIILLWPIPFIAFIIELIRIAIYGQDEDDWRNFQ